MDVIFEYLQLWDFLENFELQPDLEDTHIWQFSNTGTFSIKSAYEALFMLGAQFLLSLSWDDDSSVGAIFWIFLIHTHNAMPSNGRGGHIYIQQAAGQQTKPIMLV